MKPTGHHFLGYETSRKKQGSFTSIDATNGEPLPGTFAEATGEEIDRALTLAQQCAMELRDMDRGRRADFLDAIANHMEAQGDELLERAAAETALPLPRLRSERGRTMNQLRMFAGVVRDGSFLEARLDSADPKRKPPKPDVRRMQRALGPVVVFGASNFPLAFSVAGGDTASALAAGCPVVVKGHPNHPGTSELVARSVLLAAKECDMPDGTFSMVQGRSHEVGLALVQHPYTCAVGFTGSLRGGRALLDAAATRNVPIPVYAEMGSVNPSFVLRKAMAERGTSLTKGFATSVCMGVGQFCTNPGLIVAMDDRPTKALLDSLGQELAGIEAGIMLHQAILDTYDGAVRQRRTDEDLTSHVPLRDTPGRAAPALFSVPAKVFLDRPELADEMFGPSSLVVLCQTEDEMLSVARSLDGQLTASIHANEDDHELAQKLTTLVEQHVGRMVYNDFPTGVEVGPAMQHGGPYPATTDARSTSVGTAAISRFLRPVAWQDAPNDLLPVELRNDNPCGLVRLVDGVWDFPPSV